MTQKPKRPERIPYVAWEGCNSDGYNYACDDWENWMPSEEEISNIIQTVKYVGMVKHFNIAKGWADELAQAIHARLKG